MERNKIFVSTVISRQSNGLSKFWLGSIVLFLLLICTSLNEVKVVNSFIAIGWKAMSLNDPHYKYLHITYIK